MGRGHPVIPVMSALQGQRPISLQSRIDQQNLPFSNEVDNIISATQTFNADNFIKEFDFLQGKEVSNSNDLLAQAVSFSGINQSQSSSHKHDVLAEALISSGILEMNL